MDLECSTLKVVAVIFFLVISGMYSMTVLVYRDHVVTSSSFCTACTMFITRGGS